MQNFGLEIVENNSIVVKLADGKTITTTAYTTCIVQLGELYLPLRFEILEADISTILGMPFLEATNPQINWKARTLKIKHKGRLVDIPTLQRSTSPTHT